MARRNTKPSVRSLSDLVNDLNNNEEYGYKQLRERLAVERAAQPTAVEEEEPQGFLSSAPSDIPEEQATASAPQEEQGWWGGVVNDAALSLRTGARQLTSGVLGAPVNVANLVTNPLPLRASQWVANRFSPEEESTQGINTVMDSLRISQPEAIRGTQEMIAQETLADQAEYSSATLTEARAKYEDAKGFLDTAKVLATQPRLTSAMALEVIPQLLVRTPGSVAGTVAGQAALAGSMVESEVAADLAKKVAAGEITREQAERTASNAFAFSAGVNAVLPSLHGGGMAIERALAGQGSRRTASGIVSDVAVEGALGGLAEASDEIITNVSTGKPWNENVARSFVTGAVLEGGMAAPVTTMGAIDASRRAEVEESSRFNNSIDQAIIEQGNAMLAAREAEQAAADAQVNTARLQRAEEAIRQNEQNKNNAWANATTPDMFGADPDIVGTFEEQEALRRYEDERRALSLQERRRAFEAAEQARAADEAAYGDVVQASRDAQFDARDEERARVAATQESIDPAFNPPVESQMASQLRAALSNRGVQPAVVEEVVQEVTAPADGPVDVMASKDGRDYRYTLTTDGNVAAYDGDSNITEGREVWNPKSQEALDAASAATRIMLSLANTDVEGRAAYAAANKEIVTADMEGRPLKFSMVMREGRGRFEGQQFPSMVVAPAVGVDGTKRVYEYVLTPDKHLRRTYRDERGIKAGVEYLVTNKDIGSREWSANPPGSRAPGMEWGPAVDITTAGEEITAQANLRKNETPSTITIEQARSLYPSRQLEWMAEDGATSVSRDRAIAMATLDAHEKLRSLLGNTDGAPVEALDRLLSSAHARASEAHPGNDEASAINRRETYLQSVHDLIAEASNKDTPLGRTVSKHKAEADAGIASKFEEGMVRETVEQSKQLAEDLDSQDVTDMERRRSIKEVQATDSLFTHAAALLNIKRRRETNSLTNQEASATWDSLPKTEKFMVLESFNASPELMDRVANDVPFDSMTRHERRSVVSAMVEAPVSENIRQEPTTSAGEAKVVGNGFIGPARGRRTEPNVGESRTTRIDESDPLPFPAMQRSAGTVREDAPVAEDVVQEQLELPGMDVVQPEQTTDAALQAARKKREDRIKKEKSEALKKAKAAYAKDREKFLDDLLERGLTPAQERKQLQDWMDNNPMPTEATVTVAPAKPKTAAARTDTSTPEAKADKALEDQRKRDVAAWRRGETTAANKAAAEAKMRKLNDKDSRALIAQRVKAYRDANPNPAEIAAAPDLPENAVIADNDPRIDEQVAAMRLFDTTSTDEELREQAKQDISNTILNQDMSPSNRIPEEERATLEDVRKLLGMPADKAGRSARRAIGNGTVQLVTDQTAARYRKQGAGSATAWYDGDKMYVNVSRLNKNNLKGELLGAVGHEGKHSADASGKGKKGIANFIGVEANKILRKRIEEAASRGDVAARRAVTKATAAAEARPDLPGLYEVELPAYYITETADRPTTLFRGMVSALRVGAKDLLGIKDININDVKYMAEKMVDNLSYETEVSGDVDALLNQQAGIEQDAATVNQEDTVLNQDGDMDIPDRYNPRPNESISRSAAARFRNRGADLIKGLLFAGGGLSREANAALQDSVGESAHYAAQAEKYMWQLDRGVEQFASRTGRTVDEANSFVAERMAALDSIPSPARREAALSNLIAANPELSPMLDMYRIISGASNVLANNILARRPLTEADRQYAQQLKDSGFAYVTRIYTSQQGKQGKSTSRKMLRTAATARKKLDKGKTLTRQEQEAYSIYNDAATYLMERLTIPEVETMLGMRQTRINELFNTWVDMDAEKYRQAAYDDAIRDGADERTATELARTAMIEELDAVRDISKVDTILNDKADAVIKSLLGLEASTPTATVMGGLREDRGILKKRENLPPVLRRLMGEVTSNPSIMLAVTMAKTGELIARQKMLDKLVDEGLVVPQSMAGVGLFGDYTIKLRGDTAGALQDMVTTPSISRVLNAQLEMYSTVTDAAAISFMEGSALPAAIARAGVGTLSKVATSAKFMSIVLDPFALAMNAGGSIFMMLTNGIYKPGQVLDALTVAKDSVVNTYTEGGKYSDLLADAVRWNVMDSARLQEMRRSVNDALRDRVVNPTALSKAASVPKKSFRAYKETFAASEVWVKVAAFNKQREYLTAFYEAEGINKSADEISSEAAQITRNTNLTYANVPPVIRNFFEKLGISMFANYFWSVPQALTGSYIQAIKDIKRAKNATSTKGRTMAFAEGITRGLGTFTAMAAVPYLTSTLAQIINGMGDEDEDKIRAMADMMRDEQPYADPIYLGKDKDGKPLFFLLNRVDPYGPITDMIRVLLNDRLDWDQKTDGVINLFTGMLFNNAAVKAAYNVVTSEERGNTSVRLERLPGVGTMLKELQGLTGYADWARGLTAFADKVAVPGVLDIFDPENPTVDAGDYNSNIAAVLGIMTYATGGRAVKADPAAALRSYGFELKEKRDSARRRIALSIANNDSPERIADMIISESEGMFEDFEKIQRTYDGMVNGMDMGPREAAAILKSREGAGLNEVQVGLIRRGLLRGDREMALELAGLLSKKSVEDRVARTRGSKDEKEEAVSQSREALRILRQDYGLKVGE